MKELEHECLCGCKKIISLYRNFYNKKHEEIFFKKYPEARDDPYGEKRT